jgi:hypothetical protein
VFALTSVPATAQPALPAADEQDMSATVEVAAERPVQPHPAGSPVPCAARPSTGFVHLDGPCRCFFGGPPPEFAQPPLLHAV